MTTEIVIRLLVIVMFVVGLYFAIRARADPKKSKCPRCETDKVTIVNQQTETIDVETVVLPGVGGRTHIRTRFFYACQKCGHRWTKVVQL